MMDQPKKPRGAKLELAAIEELHDPIKWDGVQITWEALAKRLGVSRQAIATKPAVVAALNEAKKRQRSAEAGGGAAPRRSLEQRVAALQQQVEDHKRREAAWVEKWAQVEANCVRYGYNADLLWAPLGRPPVE